MKEIDDRLRADLHLVQCDNRVCQQRGTRTICYQKWQDCPDRAFYRQIIVDAEQEEAVKIALNGGKLF